MVAKYFIGGGRARGRGAGQSDRIYWWWKEFGHGRDGFNNQTSTRRGKSKGTGKTGATMWA